jgi:serine/threonine protein kinase
MKVSHRILIYLHPLNIKYEKFIEELISQNLFRLAQHISILYLNIFQWEISINICKNYEMKYFQLIIKWDCKTIIRLYKKIIFISFCFQLVDIWFAQILDGLMYLWSQNIVHRLINELVFFSWVFFLFQIEI